MGPLFFAMLAASGDGAARYFRIEATAPPPEVNTWTVGEIRYNASGVQYPTSAMTSDSTPSPLVVTASSYYTSFSPYKAFDGISGLGNSWYPMGDTSPWITIDFGPGAHINATSVTISGGLSDFAVKSSLDGVNWVTRLAVVGVWSGDNMTFTFTN